MIGINLTKNWGIYLFIGYTIIVFILGGVAARAVIGKPKTTKQETLSISDFIRDTSDVTDTALIPKQPIPPKRDTVYDTTFITADIPFGDIPVRQYTKRHDIPDGYVTVKSQYRGMIYAQGIEVYPYPKLHSATKEPFLKYFASLGLFMDSDKQMSGEITTGLRFANKVSLLCKLDIDDDWAWKPKFGIRFGL